MSKTRIKTQVPTIATREEAEKVMNALALVANTKQTVAARMDREILAIKERYSGQIAECDEVLKIETRKLETWAVANPAEFGKRKSIEFLAGTLGFRTGTPKLALLSRAFNWDRAGELVAQFLPAFIRNKPEVDKEAIIGQRDDEGIRAVLPRCGLKVIQGESFFVEPNLTNIDA